MQFDELVGLQWMALEDYFNITFTAASPLFQRIHSTIRAYVDGNYRCAF